jgi:hypothetical protein
MCGYDQVRIKEEDIHKTTFRTWYDYNKFVVVEFGLTNAPTTIICLINYSDFSEYLDKFAMGFLDDIFILRMKKSMKNI